MIEVLLEVLAFLFKLLLLAVTGEWPRNDKEDAALPARPTPAAPRVPRAPKSKVDLAQVARAQRSAQPLARTLADADTVLTSMAEPLLTHAEAQGMGLPPLTFVSLSDTRAAGPVDAPDGSRTVYLSIDGNFADMPERWVFLARHVGRGFFDAWPEYVAELRRAHRLAPSLFLPPEPGGYDAETVRAALGVWFAELFVDVFATYVLGPAYTVQLMRSLGRPKQPMDTVLARGAGRFLAPMPPSALRVHASLFVLTELGYHDWQETLHTRWQSTHPDQEALYLPLSDGRLVGVPLSYLQAELDVVFNSMLTDPPAVLGHETWLDVPGFAFLHAEQSQAEALASQLSRGEPADAPARVLVTAAALALAEDLRARPVVATALLRSLRGQGTLEAAPNAYDAQAPAAPHVASLATAFRDRKAVREALVLGAALAPLKRRSSRS